MSMTEFWASLAGVLLLTETTGRQWLKVVNSLVTEPFIDEEFHVHQAQIYFNGRFTQWDPLITTPPGLYGLSYLLYRITGAYDLPDLRASIHLLHSGVAFLASFIIWALHAHHDDGRKLRALRGRRWAQALQYAHITFNISLFPPLFFLSALYYTEMPSIIFVLLNYLCYVEGRTKFNSRTELAVLALLTGALALLMRQTNIFWVAVFPAALVTVDRLKMNHVYSKMEGATSPTSTNDLLQRGWSKSELYDPQVAEASFRDYIYTALSLSVLIVKNPTSIILPISPHLTLVGLFGAFVVWNGGVVLGDKSNHVATLHLPQMLYIWPYIVFFSFPLMFPQVASATAALLPLPFRKYMGKIIGFEQSGRLPSIPTGLGLGIFASAVVYLNTIVHPFTLADNRHYTFYVFRIFRLYPLIKYLAVPVYILCGWATIQTLGQPSSISAVSSFASFQPQPRRNRQQAPSGPRESSPPDQGCNVSFIIVWFLTTMLSLITVPLVEPRYFILPWLMWRFHVPSWRQRSSHHPGSSRLAKFWVGYDHRLWFETAWFLLVNLVTGYIFLYRVHEWPQEPGKVQRIMW